MDNFNALVRKRTSVCPKLDGSSALHKTRTASIAGSSPLKDALDYIEELEKDRTLSARQMLLDQTRELQERIVTLNAQVEAAEQSKAALAEFEQENASLSQKVTQYKDMLEQFKAYNEELTFKLEAEASEAKRLDALTIKQLKLENGQMELLMEARDKEVEELMSLASRLKTTEMKVQAECAQLSDALQVAQQNSALNEMHIQRLQDEIKQLKTAVDGSRSLKEDLRILSKERQRLALELEEKNGQLHSRSFHCESSLVSRDMRSLLSPRSPRPVTRSVSALKDSATDLAPTKPAQNTSAKAVLSDATFEELPEVDLIPLSINSQVITDPCSVLQRQPPISPANQVLARVICHTSTTPSPLPLGSNHIAAYVQQDSYSAMYSGPVPEPEEPQWKSAGCTDTDTSSCLRIQEHASLGKCLSASTLNLNIENTNVTACTATGSKPLPHLPYTLFSAYILMVSCQLVCWLSTKYVPCWVNIQVLSCFLCAVRALHYFASLVCALLNMLLCVLTSFIRLLAITRSLLNSRSRNITLDFLSRSRSAPSQAA